MVNLRAKPFYLNDEDIEWITVKGNHIPVKKGQSKDEAVKEFLEGKKDKKEPSFLGLFLF